MNAPRLIKNIKLQMPPKQLQLIKYAGIKIDNWENDYKKISAMLVEHNNKGYIYIPSKVFFGDGKTYVSYVVIDDKRTIYDVAVMPFPHETILPPSGTGTKNNYKLMTSPVMEIHFRTDVLLPNHLKLEVGDGKSHKTSSTLLISEHGIIALKEDDNGKTTRPQQSLGGFQLLPHSKVEKYILLTEYELACYNNPRLMKFIKKAVEPVISRMANEQREQMKNQHHNNSWKDMMLCIMANAISVYMTSYNYVNGDTIIHKNRLQALESLPFIITSLIKERKLSQIQDRGLRYSEELSYESTPLGLCIDNAEPFIPALQKEFSLDYASIRFLEREARYETFHGSTHLWPVLSHSRNKNIFNKIDSYDLKCVSSAVIGESASYNSYMNPTVKYLKERMSKMPFERAIPNDSVNLFDLNDTLSEMLPVLKSMGYDSVLPCIHKLAGGSSWKDISRLNKWYEIYGSRLYAMNFVDLHWKTEETRVCHTVSIDDRTFHFREIINGKEMFDEGADMEHCVAGYITQAYRGSNFIFHAEEEGADNPATLEICYGIDDSDTEHMYIRQFRGVKNKEMDNTFNAAAEQFLESIRRDEHDIVVLSEEESNKRKDIIQKMLDERTDFSTDIDSSGKKKFNVWKHCLNNNVSPYTLNFQEIIATYYSDFQNENATPVI